MSITKEQREPFEAAIVAMINGADFSKDYMFYAHLIGQCTVVFEKMNAPAAVGFDLDHYKLYINHEQFNEFTLKERLAVLKHEMLHIMNNHVGRAENRQHKAWNYATDCAINQLITRDHLPKGCIFPDNFPYKKHKTPQNGLAAEQYYDLIDHSKLPEDEGPNGSGGGSGGDSGQGGDQPSPLDSHDKWEQGSADIDPDIQKDITKGMLDNAMENTVKSRGNLPSNFSDYLELFSRKAEVSWQKVLRGIAGNKRVNSRRTIMRSDRRFPHRSDLRGKTKDRMFNLLVISDVSGSVSTPALMDLWTEVRHICDVTKSDVDLIQVDTQPSLPEKLSKSTKTIERKACGGTVLNPAIKMAQDHNIDFNAVVVTTDGYLSESDVDAFKKLRKKVIWLIESNGEIMPSMNTGLMQAFKLKPHTKDK